MVRIWKVILAALVIFGAGAVTGGMLVSLKSRPANRPNKPPQFSGVPRQRGEFIYRLQRELDLTPPQRAKIDQILHESNDRTKQIWESAREEQRKVKVSIRETLTEEQQKKFDDVFKPRDFSKPGTARPGDRRRTGEQFNRRPESERGTKDLPTPASTKP